MELGQRFILWCLFINAAFLETEEKKICFCRKPFPLTQNGKKWHLDISYSAMLGMHFFPRHVFLKLMIFWLLRSSSSSQFIFPRETVWIMQHFRCMLVPCFFLNLRKPLLLFIYSENTEKNRRVKIYQGQFLLDECNNRLLLTLLSVRWGFEVLGKRFR